MFEPEQYPRVFHMMIVQDQERSEQRSSEEQEFRSSERHSSEYAPHSVKLGFSGPSRVERSSVQRGVHERCRPGKSEQSRAGQRSPMLDSSQSSEKSKGSEDERLSARMFEGNRAHRRIEQTERGRKTHPPNQEKRGVT